MNMMFPPEEPAGPGFPAKHGNTTPVSGLGLMEDICSDLLHLRRSGSWKVVQVNGSSLAALTVFMTLSNLSSCGKLEQRNVLGDVSASTGWMELSFILKYEKNKSLCGKPWCVFKRSKFPGVRQRGPAAPTRSLRIFWNNVLVMGLELVSSSCSSVRRCEDTKCKTTDQHQVALPNTYSKRAGSKTHPVLGQCSGCECGMDLESVWWTFSSLISPNVNSFRRWAQQTIQNCQHVNFYNPLTKELNPEKLTIFSILSKLFSSSAFTISTWIHFISVAPTEFVRWIMFQQTFCF